MNENILQDIVNILEEEIDILTIELDTKTRKISKFEKLITDIKNFEDYSDYKNKYEDLICELDREKERLIKLHTLYKRIENERDNLKDRLSGWQHWFNDNKVLFDKLFSNVPPISKAETFDETYIEHRKVNKTKNRKGKKK
jgi:predicted  nucleic acid-binding Zn-ribbon protein